MIVKNVGRKNTIPNLKRRGTGCTESPTDDILCRSDLRSERDWQTTIVMPFDFSVNGKTQMTLGVLLRYTDNPEAKQKIPLQFYSPTKKKRNLDIYEMAWQRI